MKRTLLLKQLAIALLLIVPFIGNAQRLIDENFDYPAGELEGQGGWTRMGYSSTGTTIKVVEPSLELAGYQNATGNAAAFQPYGPDAYINFDNPGQGDLYMSALINLSEVQSGNFFLSFGEADPMGSSSLRGKLYAKASENQKISLGIARYAKPEYSTKELDLNSTVLVVMKYHPVQDTDDDNKNDVVSLFINPVTTEGEPATPDAVSSDKTTGADISFISSISIYQAGTKTSDESSPTGTIDAIRVSTTWEGLFKEAEAQPSIDIESPGGFVNIEENLSVGESYPLTINVKGKNLKGDIQVSSQGYSGGEVILEKTTITKTEAEVAGGFDFPYTLQPQTAKPNKNGYETLTFTSEGIEPVEITLMWSAYAVTDVATIAEFRTEFAKLETESEQADARFKLTGEVTVSHAYMDDDMQVLYVQDETGGLLIKDQYNLLTAQYATGDKLSKLLISGSSMFGTITTYPENDFGAPVSQGNAIEPAILTLAELKADAKRYDGCLVKVENVTFTPNETGIFGDEGSIYINQNDNKATVKILPEADFIGKEIPETAKSITGISTSSAGTAIAPRNLADIDADFEGGGEEPEPEEPEIPGDEVEVGENLFLDPSFENGRSSILGLQFDDWSVTGGALESEIVKEGEDAVRITGAGTAKIEQEIGALAHTFVEGEAYALTINYYVVNSQGEDDIRLNCTWGGIDVEDYDTTPLTQGFTGTVGTWESKRVRIVVPAGRQFSFRFALKVPKDAEVIFDDFSLYKLETITTGVATPNADALTTWSEHGVLFISGSQAQTVEVYSLNGMLITRSNIAEGVNTVSLPAGAYLLKAGTDVQKVLVK